MKLKVLGCKVEKVFLFLYSIKEALKPSRTHPTNSCESSEDFLHLPECKNKTESKE